MSGDRGSVLMLMPTAVLVLVVLGAIAVDFALVFLGQRELTNIAAAVANDAAVAMLDEERFYEHGELRLHDESQVHAFVTQAYSTYMRGAAHVVDASVQPPRVEDVGGELLRVSVRLQGRVEMIFSKGVPGAPTHRLVQGESTATALRDDP